MPIYRTASEGFAVSTYTVRQGRRYQATITLGFVESFAGNEIIADRLRQAGFADVSVEGTGALRYAAGVWPGDDATAELPEQITAVTEIEAA
jgi:hypothetical protein